MAYTRIYTYGRMGVMPLNIKNPVVERLAAEVAALAGESKTEAIRKALEERRSRLNRQTAAPGGRNLLDFLRREIWPHVPVEMRGKRPRQAEEDAILGYGPDGL
jgi:antitoxin VapB